MTTQEMPTRRERLTRAERLLRRDPESSIAWCWRIQIKILTFLLSVYGDEEYSPPRSSQPPLEPVIFGSIPRCPRGPRSSVEIRAILQSIAEKNREA